MTSHVNLLDWRKERRERRKKEFATAMGIGVAFAAAIVGLAYMTMVGAYDYQVARNEFLRKEIKEMDRKITEIQELERVRNNLLARMRVIEELQASRSATVHFFDEIINTLPDGVKITALKQQGSKVTLDGVAESNGRISTYMKNLDASPWFTGPRLIIIKSNEKDRTRKSTFQLQVKVLTKPAFTVAEDAEAQADAAALESEE